MGKSDFRPHTESTPLNQSQKLSQVIMSETPTAVPNLVHIRPRGPLDIWVKYNQNFCYLCPFLGNSPTCQTRRRTFAHDSSNDADSRKDVPFWVRWYGSIFRGLSPPKPNFGDLNSRFQAKLANLKNMHIIKTTAVIPTKFCTAIKTTKCPS